MFEGSPHQPEDPNADTTIERGAYVEFIRKLADEAATLIATYLEGGQRLLNPRKKRALDTVLGGYEWKDEKEEGTARKAVLRELLNREQEEKKKKQKSEEE